MAATYRSRIMDGAGEAEPAIHVQRGMMKVR
jgi:hypothetical protein